MTKNNGILLAILTVILVLAALVVFPLDKGILLGKDIRMGLDLVGGVNLLYQVDVPDTATDASTSEVVDKVITTIKNRIDKFGVTDPTIQKLGTNRIQIQLPSFTDLDAARALVEQTGYMEFREVELKADGTTAVTLNDYLTQDKLAFINGTYTGDRLFVSSLTSLPVALLKSDNGTLKFFSDNGTVLDAATLKEGETSIYAWVPARGDDGTILTGAFLSKAEARVNTGADIISSGPASVDIEWNAAGADIFDQIARRLYARTAHSAGNLLGIFLDNIEQSAPAILSSSYSGKATISGDYTIDQAKSMATILDAGALPVSLSAPIYQGKVSATLGSEFIDKSVMAFLIGILLVMLFMILYYKVPGLVACLSLVFYSIIVLAIYKIWPGGITLTLGSIGGLIVSLGMAVDANVLIFERMKEELWTGRTLGAAVGAGFNRAWTAIRDSNLTTIIACIILFWLGSNVISSGPVMGFSVTLLIGVLVSMFTAITVTRALLKLFVGTPLGKHTQLFSSYRKKSNEE